MRVLTLAGTLLLTPFLLAQGDAPTPIANLELRLLPGEMANGVPQAFTFELINVSRHNVWVPEPTVECTNTYNGYLWLRVRFTPLYSPGSETGGGCAGDKLNWPPILERAQEWKLLPPGEAVEKTVPRAELHYEVGQSGRYEFWAEYYRWQMTRHSRSRSAGSTKRMYAVKTSH
jgi:hypothetical protein